MNLRLKAANLDLQFCRYVAPRIKLKMIALGFTVRFGCIRDAVEFINSDVVMSMVVLAHLF